MRKGQGSLPGASEESPGKKRLRQYLEADRAGLERELMSCVRMIADPAEVADPQYANGLRFAVASAFDYALKAIEVGDERAPAIPPALLMQARRAARSGVGLETVLRRYFAGFALLDGAIARAANQIDAPEITGHASLLYEYAGMFDRLVAAISAEYSREERLRGGAGEERRVECVERLLAGEHVANSGLDYPFESFHLGLVATGAESQRAVRMLAKSLRCRLLSVCCSDGTIWAWLGSRHRLDPGAAMSQLRGLGPAPDTLAIGAPAPGIAGWRLTHRQAAAALPFAARCAQGATLYTDVALLASARRDELLLASLEQQYLTPLEIETEMGTALCETLRAYFAAGRNVSSAAAALGVSRQTVSNRLRAAEEKLGRPIGTSSAELEIALMLSDHGLLGGESRDTPA